MFTITTNEIVQLVQMWLWPFFRVAGLLMTAPVIGTRTVPVRVRLVMAVLITAILFPVIPEIKTNVNPVSAEGILITVKQIMIGVSMGLSMRVVFIALEMAGQAIGQLMGLMMATMVDPNNGNQVPIIGQFYLLLATLLFIAIDGHLIMISVLAESFNSMPVSTTGMSSESAWEIVLWAGTILKTAVVIALPAIVSLLIVNLSFGVMTRSAPQLNIFAVGFPIMIILGVLIIFFNLSSFVPHMMEMFDGGALMMQKVVTP
ncbi:MAG: flagellar biosynthetic protein FliR [Proteobacteria bacterium]|nr:flagellar biosynthetic protein FliR [Pseudomonadota bacterium]NOG58949.1 flagellar biosynthetic protein FliR [Pseudomonadota bacterium]